MWPIAPPGCSSVCLEQLVPPSMAALALLCLCVRADQQNRQTRSRQAPLGRQSGASPHRGITLNVPEGSTTLGFPHRWVWWSRGSSAHLRIFGVFAFFLTSPGVNSPSADQRLPQPARRSHQPVRRTEPAWAGAPAAQVQTGGADAEHMTAPQEEQAALLRPLQESGRGIEEHGLEGWVMAAVSRCCSLPSSRCVRRSTCCRVFVCVCVCVSSFVVLIPA